LFTYFVERQSGLRSMVYTRMGVELDGFVTPRDTVSGAQRNGRSCVIQGGLFTLARKSQFYRRLCIRRIGTVAPNLPSRPVRLGLSFKYPRFNRSS
jgi:hypothetical protein